MPVAVEFAASSRSGTPYQSFPAAAGFCMPDWNAGPAWRGVLAEAAYGPHGVLPQQLGPAPVGPSGYGLLPFRVTTLPSVPDGVLLTNDAGEFLLADESDFETLLEGKLDPTRPVYDDLLARHMTHEGHVATPLRLLATKMRTKKAFLRDGHGLHIFVVTLGCDHSCAYCQASRRRPGEPDATMSQADALAAIDRVFESASESVAIEFQGGEPLLAFDVVRLVVETATRRPASGKRVSFSMTSTLHHLTPDRAAFLREHGFQVSTSIDWPTDIHNANRFLPGGGAFARTMDGVALAREALGEDRVSAITTVTRRALEHPKEMVDTLVGLGFRSVFLRPLSPFGFAVRSARRIDYGPDEFLAFYARALAHILDLNRAGIAVSEASAAVLLRHILTPFHSGYVDLRSPAGPGLGVLAYDHDDSVYVSDEGRMLGAVGDRTFRLGSVHDPLPVLMTSDAIRNLARGGVAEELPGCRDCAFLPYCGTDPVCHHASQGDVAADRLASDPCRRTKGLFDLLFGLFLKGDPVTRSILTDWAANRPRSADGGSCA